MLAFKSKINQLFITVENLFITVENKCHGKNLNKQVKRLHGQKKLKKVPNNAIKTRIISR